MTAWRSRLAGTMLRHAAAMMPAARAEWARAMLAESRYLVPGEQLAFAWGCVRSSYRQRLTDPATLLAAGHWSIIVGLFAAAAICFRTAYALRAEDVSSVIFALGIICLGALAAHIRLGFRRLRVVAAAGFAASLLAMLVVGDFDALVRGAMPSSSFYRAILFEQAVAWAALFGLAHILLAVEVGRGANG